MSHSCKVLKQQWVAGILHETEELFELLEDAVEYARNVIEGSVKVYDHNGQLVHHNASPDNNTYA
jgi:hypothetical protein